MNISWHLVAGRRSRSSHRRKKSWVAFDSVTVSDDKKQKIKLMSTRCWIVIFTVFSFSTLLPPFRMIILSLRIVVLFASATCSLDRLVENTNDELRCSFSRLSFLHSNLDSIDIMRSVNHRSKKNVKIRLLLLHSFSSFCFCNCESKIMNYLKRRNGQFDICLRDTRGKYWSENLLDPLFFFVCRSQSLDDYLRMIESSHCPMKKTKEKESEKEKQKQNLPNVIFTLLPSLIMRHDNALHTIADSKLSVHNDHCWQANERKRQRKKEEIPTVDDDDDHHSENIYICVCVRACMYVCELLFLSSLFLSTVRVLMALGEKCAREDYMNGSISITASIRQREICGNNGHDQLLVRSLSSSASSSSLPFIQMSSLVFRSRFSVVEVD